MNVQRIRMIARDRGLKPGNAKKVELVRAIQRNEGNSDCFARADSNFCDQHDCLWREDCLPAPLQRSRAD